MRLQSRLLKNDCEVSIVRLKILFADDDAEVWDMSGPKERRSMKRPNEFVGATVSNEADRNGSVKPAMKRTVG